jgi:hypothetical protein
VCEHIPIENNTKEAQASPNYVNQGMFPHLRRYLLRKWCDGKSGNEEQRRYYRANAESNPKENWWEIAHGLR